MNPKQLVKLSNVIGIVSILLLMYWIFIFITIEVFGLKVFRENMTETFYMSVFGIVAFQIERTYLKGVFEEGNTNYRYSAHDGRYELFYPYKEGDQQIVLYFSDYQQYGK